jgi:WD40 repeat protein
VAVTPDGRRAVSVSREYTPRLWDLKSGKTLRTLEGHTDSVFAIAVTSDGLQAVSASPDGTLRLWNLESGKEVATFTGENPMHSCVIAPDGSTIVAGDGLGRVHFLRLAEADPMKPSTGDTKIQFLQHIKQR